MRATPAILSVCAAIAVVGCSDDEKPVRTVTVGPKATLRMGADEYRFDPGRIVVKARKATARLGIVLSNRGTLAHNIHVRDGRQDLAATRSFRPGQRRALSVSLPPGSYEFVCTVADHDDLGMTGKIEVR